MAKREMGQEQPLQERFERILAKYRNARDHEAFGKANPLWQTFEDLATELRNTDRVAKSSTLKIRWSAGQGRWANVPWIAALDTRETKRISEGVYAIYLFRADLAGVYLTINQGASWALNTGNQREGFAALRTRAAELRSALEALPAEFDLSGTITLGSSAPLIRAYEASTVAARYYVRGGVPDDAVLRADFKAAITTYQRLVPTSRLRVRNRASLS